MMKNWVEQVPAWYQGYISKVDVNNSIGSELVRAQEVFEETINAFTEEQSLFRYQEGKWSIKDLLQHLMDAERVFAYRALRLARGDNQGMTGYDHNRFVEAASADLIPLSSLKKELGLLRSSTVLMFENLSEDHLDRLGKVDENQFSAKMLGYIIAGHQLHHATVISEKYIGGLN